MEPDHVRIDGRVDYDPTAGRLGSLCQVHLDGSDDDTTIEVVVRTEFLIWVPWEQIWTTSPTAVTPIGTPSINAPKKKSKVQVVLDTTANECWIKGNTREEPGVSVFGIKPKSAFYLRFPESWDDARLSYFDASAEHTAGGLENWGIWDLIDDLGTTLDATLVEPDTQRAIALHLNPPRNKQAELPVIVGLENKLWTFTNDISYDITFVSSWTLDAVSFSGT